MGTKMDNGSRNVFLVCATIMFCVVVAGASAIVRWEADSTVATTLITILFASLGPTIAGVAVVIKGEAIKSQVSDIKDDTSSILNGAMDAKLSAAVKRELTILLDEHLPPKPSA